MNIPFTVNEFFGTFEAYNTAIWPAQVIAYVLGIAAVGLAMGNSTPKSRIVTGILALLWCWSGLVYHFHFFSRINPAAHFFGALFVLQGFILTFAGYISARLKFRLSYGGISNVGALFVFYAMAIYPLLGRMAGHSYPRIPMFGVSPCPLTIFTFGLLLWGARPIPLYVAVIPLFWSLVGISAAVELQVPEDYGLGVAGILGMVLAFARNRKLKRLIFHSRA